MGLYTLHVLLLSIALTLKIVMLSIMTYKLFGVFIPAALVINDTRDDVTKIRQCGYKNIMERCAGAANSISIDIR